MLNRRGFLGLTLTGLTLVIGHEVLPLVKDKSDASIPIQEERPNYIRLNSSEGIIFEEEEYLTIGAHLYIDTNTSNEKYPSTRLELTALLDISTFKLMIGRRIGKTDRTSGIILREDIVQDFKRISSGYEDQDYSSSNTDNLVTMLSSEDVIPESMPPNSRLVIDYKSDSLVITSKDSSRKILKESKISNPIHRAAYGNWMNRRLLDPYQEIQRFNDRGDQTSFDITHLTFLNQGQDSRSLTFSN